MMQNLQSWLAPFEVDAINIDVNDLRQDSREVTPGDVFIATGGFSQHGAKFIDDAISKGAVAVLTDVDESEQPLNTQAVPVYSIGDLPNQLPKLLGSFYQKGETALVGITGTNGKTTISQLLAQFGRQLNNKVAVVGTLGAGTLDNLVEMNNTTPGICNNYRLLAEFAEQGCDMVAMEVSSQGLAMGRVDGIDFDATVFSNLTQDHLDYHGDMATYADAKRQLFDLNPDAKAVININDSVGIKWYRQWLDTRNLIAVGAFDEQFEQGEHVMFDQVQYTTQGLAFTLKSSWGEAQVVCPLFGGFNLHNLVSAMAVHLSQGESLAELVAAAGNIEAVAGRMEKFGNDEVIAIVDYAHTPDALAQALQSVKAHVDGKLWCIFGCGGDRDVAKRPLMGQMAAKYADQIVVTNDNPRHELPQQIAEQILAGIEDADAVTVELDRKKAIKQTLRAASKGDIVLIAGKGHETYQIFGDETIEYDERAFVRQCFAQKIEEMAS